MSTSITLIANFSTWLRMDDYSKFDAATYLRTRYSNPEDGRSKFYLDCFHEFYQQYHTQWDHTKARLLEFGGGPVIVPLISAAPFVSGIVFSDHAESGRKAVQLWKDNDPKAHNWMPYIAHVVNILERNADSEAALVRERILRNRLHSIVSCDINADEGKLLGCGVVQERFDIISLNGCVETAVNSSSQYLTCLAKLKTLLKPGGLLIGVQLLDATWWKVQDETYNCFPITEDMVTASLQQAGFSILEKKTAQLTVPDWVSEVVSKTAGGVMFVVAKAD